MCTITPLPLMSILNTKHTWCHLCPVQYWAHDIYPVMQDWQIPSRTLLSLSMLCEVPINCLYGHPVTDNVRSVTKHLTPHLGKQRTTNFNIIVSFAFLIMGKLHIEQGHVLKQRFLDLLS
ncbi:hypothetical protein QL285_015127 [Trifolium repens]|nr:hypothetical protein QL285_015127 [Trifolium repens]